MGFVILAIMKIKRKANIKSFVVKKLDNFSDRSRENMLIATPKIIDEYKSNSKRYKC